MELDTGENLSLEMLHFLKDADHRYPDKSVFEKFCEILWAFHFWHLEKTSDIDKTHEAFLERLWHFRNLRWKLETSSHTGILH